MTYSTPKATSSSPTDDQRPSHKLIPIPTTQALGPRHLRLLDQRMEEGANVLAGKEQKKNVGANKPTT